MSKKKYEKITRIFYYPFVLNKRILRKNQKVLIEIDKMADNKVVLNIGMKDGKTVKFNLDDDVKTNFYGLNVGDEFSGDLISDDFSDYTLKITGGSDFDGVPMRHDYEGMERRKILFSKRAIGYNPRLLRKGARKRKMVRGAEIFDDISQINTKVIKEGKKPLN